MVLFTCPRCNGNGSVSFARHYANGVCFACGGAGKLSATAKALSDAERAGLEYSAACEAARARECSPAQASYLAKIAMRLGVAEAKLVAVSLGQDPYNYDPEFTKTAVSGAIDMFKSMQPIEAKRLCHPKRAAA